MYFLPLLNIPLILFCALNLKFTLFEIIVARSAFFILSVPSLSPQLLDFA